MRRRTLILRTLLGVVIAALVAAVVVLAFYVEQERRDTSKRLGSIESRIENLESRVESVSVRLNDTRSQLISEGIISAIPVADEPAAAVTDVDDTQQESVAEPEEVAGEAENADDAPARAAPSEDPEPETPTAEPAAEDEPAVEDEPVATDEPAVEDQPTSEPEPTLGEWQDWEGSWTDSNLNPVVGYGFLVEGTSNKRYDEPTLVFRCVNDNPDVSVFTGEILSHEDDFSGAVRLGNATVYRNMRWSVFGDYKNNMGVLSPQNLSRYLLNNVGVGTQLHIAAPNDGYVASFDIAGFEDVLAALPCYAELLEAEE